VIHADGTKEWYINGIYQQLLTTLSN